MDYAHSPSVYAGMHTFYDFPPEQTSSILRVGAKSKWAMEGV
jgi:hypothetical protein